ncbi:hypothetical protein BKA69DRAFT_1025371 [Paraphysoderma sedebokerense]|nr:hypothetical protein BKA69DRAFT_1025371 [Paraphysoderma sedebokerense]
MNTFVTCHISNRVYLTVTEQLLRKRAEHNDGELSSLQEITLHQFDIEKIENLDIYCRHLRILFLQNNQIQKIENLQKLKELEYLNLALNNITRIENLEGCESLRKLDLTVNFIDDIFCLENLRKNDNLRELFLVGNPITDVAGYRNFVIATLPQLESLDGVRIERSHRIIADQEYPTLRSRLLSKGQQNPSSNSKSDQVAAPSEKVATIPPDGHPNPEAYDFQHSVTAHNPQSRIETARQLAKLKENQESKTKKEPKPPKTLIRPDGRILQCNEGNYPFKFTYLKHITILEVTISKFLDTSLMDVEVQPTYIKVLIKGKLLQVLVGSIELESKGHLEADRTVVQRNISTGALIIYCAHTNPPIEGNALEILRWEQKKDAEERRLKEDEMKRKEKKKKDADNERMLKYTDRQNSNLVGAVKSLKVERRAIQNRYESDDEFDDDDEVPPLI